MFLGNFREWPAASETLSCADTSTRRENPRIKAPKEDRERE